MFDGIIDWMDKLEGKGWISLVLMIVGYCFLIAALGTLGIIGTVLITAGGSLWLMDDPQIVAPDPRETMDKHNYK